MRLLSIAAVLTTVILVAACQTTLPPPTSTSAEETKTDTASGQVLYSVSHKSLGLLNYMTVDPGIIVTIGKLDSHGHLSPRESAPDSYVELNLTCGLSPVCGTSKHFKFKSLPPGDYALLSMYLQGSVACGGAICFQGGGNNHLFVPGHRITRFFGGAGAEGYIYDMSIDLRQTGAPVWHVTAGQVTYIGDFVRSQQSDFLFFESNPALARQALEADPSRSRNFLDQSAPLAKLYTAGFE